MSMVIGSNLAQYRAQQSYTQQQNLNTGMQRLSTGTGINSADQQKGVTTVQISDAARTKAAQETTQSNANPDSANAEAGVNNSLPVNKIKDVEIANPPVALSNDRFTILNEMAAARLAQANQVSTTAQRG